jgi:tetratricopeptide (TPR) repeat protein
MSTDEISTWLQQGLDAIKSGDRVFGREQLLCVVEADEHNLPAWLALSEVAATLEDREVCLENAATLDPDNVDVRRQLDEVKAQLADVDAEAVKEALSPLAISAAASRPISPRLDLSDEDLKDPLLCVYCAQPTREEDRSCPHCHRNLVLSFYEREHPRWIGLGWILSILEVLYNVVVMGAVLFFMAIALSAVRTGERIDLGQLLLLYGGQATSLSPQTQELVFTALPREFFYFRVGYIILITLVAFGLLTRQRIFHLAYIGCLAVATALTVMTYQFSNTIIAAGNSAEAAPVMRILRVAIFEVSNVFTVLIGVLAVVLVLTRLLLIFLMEDDFAKDSERLWNHADQGVKNARTAFVRAKAHMRDNRWTLAAAYLQQAVAMDLGTPDYLIALAESYAHLKRYPRALALLDQAEQLHRGHPAVIHLRKVILEVYSRTAGSKEPDPSSKGKVTA